MSSKFESSFPRRRPSETGGGVHGASARGSNTSLADLVDSRLGSPIGSLQYDMGPSLEDGYKDEIWGSNSYSETASTFSVPQVSLDVPVVPSLGLVDDPMHYLKNQEIVVVSKLLETIENHRRNLQKGSKRVKRDRQSLLSLFAELNQIHQAMKEIYTTEKHNKSAVLNNFQRWETKKGQLFSKIDEIQNNTVEGATYKTLLTESNKINSEIKQLEEKLQSMKQKQKQVNQQLRESKSLLDIKLNTYYDSLNQLESKEFVEMEALQSTKLIQKQFNPVTIIENFNLQLNALTDLIHVAESKETSFHECSVYLTDAFETLSSLEESLKAIISDTIPEKTDLLLKQLDVALDALTQRRDQAKKSHLDYIQAILTDEITAIQNTISTIKGEEPKELKEPKPILKPSFSNSTMHSLSSSSPLPIKPAYSLPIASTSDVTAGTSGPEKYVHAKTAIQNSKGEKRD